MPRECLRRPLLLPKNPNPDNLELTKEEKTYDEEEANYNLEEEEGEEEKNKKYYIWDSS